MFFLPRKLAGCALAVYSCLLWGGSSPCSAQTRTASGPQIPRQDISPLLQNPNALWQAAPDAFARAAQNIPFVWESQALESARTIGVPLAFGPLPVAEASVRFSQQKLTTFTLLFYSRGDSGEMTRSDYEKLVGRTVEALNGFIKAKPQPRGQDPSNAVRADGFVWKTPGTLWTLEFSAERKMTPLGVQVSPAFIRLEVTPEKTAQRSTTGLGKAAPFVPKQKVRKLPSGDTLIEGIPMVDQGLKGYCFPASAERVLRYYGMRVDQHEVAQLAGNRGEGTTLVQGLEGLQTAGSRLQFRVKLVDKPGVRDLENLVREYNARALRYGPKEQIPPLRGMINLEALYFSMRPETLNTARQAQRLEKNRFLRAIQGAIDAGHPMIWGVLVGLVPEQNQSPSNERGGHARLIIGYNAKTQECLYSDSWGPGHELKRMSFEHAWLMHQFCFLLIPQGIESPSLSQDK